MPMPWLLIDFDSTFVTVESLEMLAGIPCPATADERERKARVAAIGDLTRRAMAGRMPFREALEARLGILRPRVDQLPALVAALRNAVSPSFRRHAAFLREHAGSIYIVSAGFREYIDPVVADFGIPPSRVLANRFVPRPDGTLDFDRENPLSRDGGKVEAVRQLHLREPAVAIGDGISDLELGLSGVCDTFIAYTETVERPEVLRQAPRRAGDFGAVIEYLREREKRP